MQYRPLFDSFGLCNFFSFQLKDATARGKYVQKESVSQFLLHQGSLCFFLWQKQNFTHLLCVHIYARLHNFIQLSQNWMQLCHIMHEPHSDFLHFAFCHGYERCSRQKNCFNIPQLLGSKFRINFFDIHCRMERLFKMLTALIIVY